MIHMHPGYGDRAYVVVRWTAPAAGTCSLDAVFTGLDSTGATTDAHVLVNGRELFAGDIRGGLECATNVASCSKTIAVAAGDMIDFAVGPGGNGNGFDSTGLTAKITLVAPASGGTVYDAAADLTKESIAANANPNGPWSYGYRGSAESSDFTPFPTAGVSALLARRHRRRPRLVAGAARGFDMMPPDVLANVGTKPWPRPSIPFPATLRPGNLYVPPGGRRPRAYASCGGRRRPQEATGSTRSSPARTRGATTDPHVVLNGRGLFAGNIRGGMDTPTNVASYQKTISMAKGDTVDFAVGPGGNGNICDSTG